MHHLCRQAPHGNNLGIHDSFPQRVRHGTAGATGPSGFAGAFLSALGIGSTECQTTTGEAATKAGLDAGMHNAGKEGGTFVLAFFRGIHVETAFVSQDTTTHIKGTASTPNASEAMDFETKKEIGTILFSVRSRLNGNE